MRGIGNFARHVGLQISDRQETDNAVYLGSICFRIAHSFMTLVCVALIAEFWYEIRMHTDDVMELFCSWCVCGVIMNPPTIGCALAIVLLTVGIDAAATACCVHRQHPASIMTCPDVIYMQKLMLRVNRNDPILFVIVTVAIILEDLGVAVITGVIMTALALQCTTDCSDETGRYRASACT